MTVIEPFEPFVGLHCETTATTNLLRHAGLPVSEPMVFGLGEGLSFAVLVFKNAPAPFIAGRSRPEQVTRTLAETLGIELDVRQTRSPARAWRNIADAVDAGRPVAAKLDAHFLDYYSGDHFAGHYLAVYGYDDDCVCVVDSMAGVQRVHRDSFEKARLWRGPMASNALTWTVTAVSAVDWPTAVRAAIAGNSADYLNPPIRSFGARGIRKAAELAPRWVDTIPEPSTQLPLMAHLMEHGGTGGGLFRAIYRDFLLEVAERLGSLELKRCAALFDQAADLWTQVAAALDRAGHQGTPSLQHAADLMSRVADVEESAFTRLADWAGPPSARS